MDAPQSALQDSAKDTPEGMSSLSAAEQRKLKKEQEAKDRRIRRQQEERWKKTSHRWKTISAVWRQSFAWKKT